jgi:thymidylate kinase
MEIDIFEGARGTGKSTLAFKMRQRTPETTLINFTGFHTDGEAGLWKATYYYKTWFKYLFQMYNHDSKLVFDRFYFSESVFSNLYKEYDFLNTYLELNEMLEQLSVLDVKINIFLGN